MRTIVTNVPAVCLSRGSTWFHCAKTTEQIKILFGVKTLGGPINIVLDGGPDPDPPHSDGVGDSMQPLPNYFGLLLYFFCLTVHWFSDYILYGDA